MIKNKPDELSESKRYFTPSIEDIRVGYECEKIVMDFSRHISLHINSENPKDWENAWDTMYESDKFQSKPHILTAEDVKEILFVYRKPQGIIRVPYLTKEQIEAEGWKEGSTGLYTIDDKPLLSMKKGKYVALFNLTDNYVEIGFWVDKEVYRHIYQGECKDINTFRYISKLLGI